MNFIKKDQLLRQAEALAKSGYGIYLKNLVK
jgi:dTDP-glucose pyrophosphorylase